MRFSSALAVLAGVVLASAATPASAGSVDATYDASILNIVTLGKLSLKGQVTSTAYTMSGSVQTAGLAALFDETALNAQSSGARSGAAVVFSSYTLSHTYAKPGGKQKSRSVQMQKTPAGVAVAARPTWSNMGSPPTSATQKAASNDPLTMLMAMSTSVGAAKGCNARLLAFDGKEHYAIALSPGGGGVYKGGGYDGKAIICKVKYEPIAGGKPLSAAERAQIPTGEAWFGEPGATGFAPLLRVEVPTPVGAARLDVSSLKVS